MASNNFDGFEKQSKELNKLLFFERKCLEFICDNYNILIEKLQETIKEEKEHSCKFHD